MDEKKDLSEIDLKAQADEVRGEIRTCATQIATANDSVNQAEADRREARAAYNESLESGDKQGMDAALAKLAAAAEMIQSKPVGIEDIEAQIGSFESRQKELITEARRRKVTLETEIAELTKRLPGAEGLIGAMQSLAIEIGKLREEIKDLQKKLDDKSDKNKEDKENDRA